MLLHYKPNAQTRWYMTYWYNIDGLNISSCNINYPTGINSLRLSDAYMCSTTIGSYDGLSPGRRQTIFCWTNGGILLFWTLRNKRQWNINRNSYISYPLIQKITSENVVWEVSAIFKQILHRGVAFGVIGMIGIQCPLGVNTFLSIYNSQLFHYIT